MNLTGSTRVILISLLLLVTTSVETYPYQRPPVCDNVELRRAIRTIYDACNDITCDFSKLQELEDIDKSKLLAALRNPYLRPVHLFFPSGRTQLQETFDWRTTKQAQLDSVKLLDDPENTIVFVIGRASVTGNRDLNIRLSRERMLSVMDYLKNKLQVRCHKFKGGWLGKEYLQLTPSDATVLNLNGRDYRDDELVLNQAVHVFVFPCKDVL
jgi:outer membrane protein OmpA-like peptidoglycan-associated protein